MPKKAISLLSDLIATPSYSREETSTADMLFEYLSARRATPFRHYNNVWAVSDNFDPSQPTLLLNSHHDTVRPATGWTIDPHKPQISDGRLYGLGSNDAGASVVSLIATFLLFKSQPLRFNIILAITAEEEVGGEKGIRALLPHLAGLGYAPTMALVGEPTDMQPAVGERGLVVLDCTAHGVAGHAARGEGTNAIYKAMADIETLRNLQFPRVSELLGPIGLQVTMIESGTQHNVVPDNCRFVVDVRTTDAYSNKETVELIRQAIESDARPRSTRVHASVIDPAHPLVAAAKAIGGRPFVSPTTSDMSLMHGLPSLKIGPGSSSRSHKADEYIGIAEITGAITAYGTLLNNLNNLL